MPVSIPPPPTWSPPNSPAWLDWYLTVGNLTQGTYDSIQAGLIGFSQSTISSSIDITTATDVLTISYTSTGGVILIISVVGFTATADTGVTAKLYRDTTQLGDNLYNYVLSGTSETIPFVYAEQPAAGSYSYKMNLEGTADATAGTLILLELK